MRTSPGRRDINAKPRPYLCELHQDQAVGREFLVAPRAAPGLLFKTLRSACGMLVQAPAFGAEGSDPIDLATTLGEQVIPRFRRATSSLARDYCAPRRLSAQSRTGSAPFSCRPQDTARSRTTGPVPADNINETFRSPCRRR